MIKTDSSAIHSQQSVAAQDQAQAADGETETP